MTAKTSALGSRHDSRVRGALERYRDHVNPTLAKLARFSSCDRVEWRGEGALVFDTNGQEYVDCVASFGALSAGHAHPRIVAAVTEQLSRMGLSTKLLLNEPMVNLAAALANIAPGKLQYSFFLNSGAEAIEAALKFTRLATGRPGVISMIGGFHGKTFGALSASGRQVYKQRFEPLLPGFVQVPFGDLEAIRSALTPQTGGILLEPIQGEGGVIVPPEGYLAAVRKLATERNVLLLVDEVQTGLGRTGRTFAVEKEGVAPDMCILGKALGGGVMPISAVMGTADVWKELIKNPTLHSTTFGGNPASCAAALAFLAVLEEERLAEKAERQGRALRTGLQAIAHEYPSVVAEVRGCGLLIGLQLTEIGLTAELCSELMHRGVLAFYTVNNERVLRVEPPLVITDDQVQRVLAAFADSIARVAEVATPDRVVGGKGS